MKEILAWMRENSLTYLAQTSTWASFQSEACCSLISIQRQCMWIRRAKPAPTSPTWNPSPFLLRPHESEQERVEQSSCGGGKVAVAPLTRPLTGARAHPRVIAPPLRVHAVVPLDGDQSKHSDHPDQRRMAVAPEPILDFDIAGFDDGDK
jgi:hypothetical protein